MDKYFDGQFDNNKYTKDQLSNLKGDLTSQLNETLRTVENIDKILCGLNKKHFFVLDRFEPTHFPCAKPPGVYFFKCETCGETLAVKATQMKELVTFDNIL